MALEELNTYSGAVDNTPNNQNNPEDNNRIAPDNLQVQTVLDPVTINQGPTQVGKTHQNNLGRIVPGPAPGMIDLEVRDVLIPSPLPIGPLDPTVVENADVLQNVLKYNPVEMNFPGVLDPNSPIYKQQPTPKLQLTDLQKEIQMFGQDTNMPDPVTAEQPLRFGIKATNYDRYDAPGFEQLFNDIGFHPYVDNESYYNANSTWWDENARMRSQWGKIFSTGFMSTYRAISDAFRGDYLAPDTSGSDVFEDAMRIGNSSKGGTGAFFNNLALNSGYTFGILANIAVEELALAGLEAVTFGGATPVVASRTAYNLVRGGKALRGAPKVKQTAAASKSLLQRMKNFDFTRDVWNAGGRFLGNAVTPNTYKAIKNIYTTNNTARQLSGLAKISSTVGGLYRDVRAVNLAMSESKLEAGFVENSTFNNLYSQHLADFGAPPTGKPLEDMRMAGAEAAFTATLWNFPLIYFSNAIVFDTALRGFKGLAKPMADLTTEAGKRVVRKTKGQLAKETAKKGTKGSVEAYVDLGKTVSGFGIRRTFKRGIRGNLNLLKWGGLRYFGANYVEGMQEVGQEAIAVGAEDYYTNLYNDPSMGGIDAQMASIYHGIGSQMTSHGFEVFMSGFLMGGLVQGPQKLVFNTLPELFQSKFNKEKFAAYDKSREDYIKNVVKVSNEVYNDPDFYFNETKLNAIQQKLSNEDFFAASYAGSALNGYDAKDSGIFHHLYTLAESGKLHDFRQDIKAFQKLDDKALLEAFPQATEEDVKSGKLRERLTQMETRLDKIDKAYKKLNDEIINPFDPSLYKEGTQEHLNEKINQAAFHHAKMISIFANDTFERAVERANSMYNDISEISGEFATNDVDNLLDIKKLISEIDLLKIEIELSNKPEIVLNEEGEAVEQKKELSDDEKILIEKKKERLVLLQNIFKVLSNPAFVNRGPFVSVVPKQDEEEEQTEQQKATEQQIYEKSLETMRARILSDEALKTDPDLIRKLAASVSDPFGEFKTENIEELTAVIRPYLEFLLINTENADVSSLPTDITEIVQKIIDYKTVKGRSEDVDFAMRNILSPENLASLAEKIAPRFKKVYFENKGKVEERIRNYVGIVERNEFLSTLAKAGIFPRDEQVAKFLKDGTMPTIYGNYNGVIDETSGQPWTILQDAIKKYEGIRSKKDKPKSQETTEKDETNVDDNFNYEENFEDIDPEPEVDPDNIEAEQEKIEDKKIAKDYLKEQWRKYVKLRSSKDQNYLDYTAWLKSDNSRTVRKRAKAINDIVQNVYTPAIVSGETTKPFYEFLSEKRNDRRVRDILRLYNLTIGQISSAALPKSVDTSNENTKKRKTTPHSSGLNIQKRSMRTKEGEEVTEYIIVDNNKDPINDNIYSTAREATTARNAIAKAETPEETYTIGQEQISKGEIVQDKNGNWWTVQSDKKQVEGGKITLHKYNVKNPRKKDKKNIKISTFQKGYTVVTNDEINFINTVSKLPVREPLTVFPARDNKIENYEERVAKSVEQQQEFFRKLTPSQIELIDVEIIKNQQQGDIDIRNRRSFRFGDKETNDKIKLGSQRYSIKLSLYNSKTKTNDVLGYFQGPETALFLTQSGKNGKQLSPFQIDESNVREYFIIYPNQNIQDVVKQIHENYTAGFYIYDQIDKMFENRIESKLEVKLSDLPFLSAALSPGQQSLNPNNDRIPFNTLETQFVLGDTTDTTDGNKPYYILDFQRDYERRGDDKITALPITNIKSNTELRARIREKVKDFQKSDIKNKLGRYFAYVELENGAGSFVDLSPAEMSDADFNKMLADMKKVSQDTYDNNTEEDKAGARVAKKLNYKNNDELSKKLSEELFIATDKKGEYITLSYSPASGLTVDYVNLNVKKNSKKRKGKGFMSNDNLQKVRDQVDFAKELNSIIKDASGIDIKPESFKYSVNKEGEGIDIIGLMLTRHKPEIKSNFSLQLKVDPVEISLEKYQANLLKSLNLEEVTEDNETEEAPLKLTSEEKIEIVKSDYKAVSREKLKSIARKLVNGEVLDEFDNNILEENNDVIDGLKLEIISENNEGVITESGAANQTVLDALDIAEKALDDFIKDYRKARLEELGDTMNQASKNRLINKEIKDFKSNPANPLYLSYRKLINTINQLEDDSNAYKITDEFDGNDIEDVDTFGRWLQENVNTDYVQLDPGLVVDKMINDKTIVGKVIMSFQRIADGTPGLTTTIKVGTDTPFKYHEAFHAVFRTFLTDAEISKYLSLAAVKVNAKLKAEGKTLDQALEEMRMEHPMYTQMDKATLTDRLYEEFMADEFDKFKMDQRSANVDTETKSLFQRIIDLILSILGRFQTNTLTRLYKNIDSGKYKNAGVAQNRFTSPFLNEFDTTPSVALKVSIKLGTKTIKKFNSDKTSYIKKRINNYMPADDQHTIISGITNLFIMREMKSDYPNPEVILDEAIFDFIELYNPDREFYTAQEDWYTENAQKIDLYYTSLLNQADKLKEAVLDRLADFNYQVDQKSIEREEAEADFGDITSEQWDRQVNEIGGYGSAPRLVRRLLAGTTIAEQDMFGNKFVDENNKEPVLVSIDYNMVYESLLKIAAGETNTRRMLEKIWVYADGNPQTKAAVDEMYKQMGIIEFARSGELFDPTQPMPTINSESGVQESLYQMFTNTFKNFRQDYMIVHRDKGTGIVHLYSATKSDDAHHSLIQMADSFNTKYSKLKIEGSEEKQLAIDALEDLAQFISYRQVPEDINLLDEAKRISTDLYNTTGIKVSANYLLFSLYQRLIDQNIELDYKQELLFEAFDYAEPIVFEDVQEITKSIQRNENIFLDNQFDERDQSNNEEKQTEQEQDTETEPEQYEAGAQGRLRSIALNNAYFDESIGSSTFFDAENNRIYSHQQGTFHLEKIAEMDNADFIDLKKGESAYMSDNFLINDPAFQSMVMNGQVRSMRIGGYKEGRLAVSPAGKIKAAKSYNRNEKGTKFGSLTPQQFILSVIDAYLYNYNRISPDKTKLGSYEGKDGPVKFAMSPNFIRVIEASDTGDFVTLPVRKMIEDSGDGIQLTKEGIEGFKEAIKQEFNRIRQASQEGNVDNEENFEKKLTFTNTKELLKIIKKRNRLRVSYRDPNLGADVKEAIISGNQKVMLSNTTSASFSNLSANQQGRIMFEEIDPNVDITMSNQGKVNAKDLSDEQVTQLIKDFGSYIGKTKEGKRIYTFSIGETTYYTYSPTIAQFFQSRNYENGRELTLFRFTTSEDQTALVLNEDGSVEAADVDMSVVEVLETFAKDPDVTFETAWNSSGAEEVMTTRLINEATEFIELLKDFKAYNKISSEISVGLGKMVSNDKGTVSYDRTDDTEKISELYNLKDDSLDYNLVQIFLNNYLNTKTFNDLILGDQSITLGDAITAIKRAKMQNAAGKAAAHDITAPALGINHSLESIAQVTYNDSRYKKLFTQVLQEQKPDLKPGERGDGQMLITLKAMRHFMFGFGTLTKAQARILDLIDEGDLETVEREFFGTRDFASYKKLDAIINSQKLVYGDGQTYLKMSAFILTKNFTSVKDASGNWVAIDGREGLHNLREKLEKYESDNNTVGIAVPESASKMYKRNVITERDAFSTAPLDETNTSTIDAAFMRQQVINPSNKTEQVDARQILNLITGEQNRTDKVMLDGVELPVGDVIDLYHQAREDKQANAYFSKRNLVFDFKGILTDFLDFKQTQEVTPRLTAFLQFAQAGLRASQAKSQMLSYFSMEESGTGDPDFNLNNQLTARKFQELFLSFISKGTISARQPGISAALVSDDQFQVVKQVIATDAKGTPTEWRVIRQKDWESIKADNTLIKKYADPENEIHEGLSKDQFYLDRLRMAKDKDGNEYMEMVIPPHFKSILDNLDQLDMYEDLPDSIAKYFGVRIPSQDKHSAANLKVVDWLPVYYGSSAIFARELVELSGADFDIDKLYMQIKDFYYANGQFKEFGSAQSEIDKYEEYVEFIKREVKNPTSIYRQAVDAWVEQGSVIEEGIVDVIKNEDYDALSREERARITQGNFKIAAEILSLDPTLDIESDLFFKTVYGVPEALTSLGLPVSFEQYTEFKEKNRREPYNAPIDNKILDYKFALLGHPGMSEGKNGRPLGIAKEPANLVPLKDDLNKMGALEFILEEMPELAEFINDVDIDVDNFNGQLLAYESNKEGARSIGTVVLPNIVVNILKEFGIEVRTRLVDDVEQIKRFTYNDVEYTKFVDYVINEEGVADPKLFRTQFIISALVTAMTDNAKERLAAKLGLKKQTLGMVTQMTAMGLNIKDSVLMLQHPTIKKALFEATNKEDIFDPGFATLLGLRMLALENYFADNEVDTDKLKFKFNRENLIDSVRRTPLNPELASDEIDPKTPINDLVFEYTFLEQFTIALGQADFMYNMSVLLQLQTGFTRDLYDFNEITKAAEKLGLYMSNKEFAESNLPFDVRPIFKGENSFHAFYFNAFEELRTDLLPKLFVELTDPFKKIENTILGSTTIRDKADSVALTNNVIAILNTMAYMESLRNDSQYNGTQLASLNNAFIYPNAKYGIPLTAEQKAAGITENLDIASVVTRLRENSNYNYFIDEFISLREVDSEHNYEGLTQVITNNFTRLSDANLTNIQNDILSLYSNRRTYKDTLHLVNYLLVKDGFMRAKNSFISVLPIDLTRDILNSIDKVQKLFLTENAGDEAYKRVFGKTYSDLKEYIVFEYLQRTSNKFFLKRKNNDAIATSYLGEYEEIDYEDGRIIIDADVTESETSSNMLSRYGKRSFTYAGKTFYSVEHAYQVMLSGSFDASLDKKWRSGKGDPIDSIPGKRGTGKLKSRRKGKDNAALLTQLTRISILQNANMETENGVPLAQQVVYNSQFDFVGETKADADAIRQGISQARSQLRFETVKDQNGVEDLKYISTEKIAEREKASKDALKSPVYDDTVKGEFIIDLYKGLPTFFDKTVKKIRRLKVKKGDATGVQKLKDNANEIRKAGFVTKFREIKVQGQTFVRLEIDAPLEFLRTNRDGVDEVYKLVEVQRDGDYKAEDKLDLLLPTNETEVFGNYLRYKNIGPPKGSRSQNVVGFLFGESPNEQQIDQLNLAKFAMDVEDVSDDFEAQEEDFTTEEDAREGEDQTAELFSALGVAEEATTEEEAEAEDVDPGTESLEEQLELTKDALVEAFYDNLTEEQKEIVGTKDEIMEAYLSYQQDAEEFIENIKKCYLK